MRVHSSKKPVCEFLPGQSISGRWHGNVYSIVRLLGEGAIGKVYLAKKGDGAVALKVAHHALSVSSEVHVLRRVSKVHGLSLGPSFLDMDDVLTPRGTVTFYAMEYIQGEEFLPFVKSKGIEWLGIFMVQLLGELHHLHQAGWAFGDLKPENLLVTRNPSRLRWIDPGGITKAGRSIKEYTEFFDRGYWGAGDRRAEPSYDLFAAAMLMVNRSYPSRFYKKGGAGPDVIMDYVHKKAELSVYAPVIENGIYQRYHDALQMKTDLLEVLRKQKAASPPSRKKKRSAFRRNVKIVPAGKPRDKQAAKERKGLGATFIFASFLLFIYVLYLTG